MGFSYPRYLQLLCNDPTLFEDQHRQTIANMPVKMLQQVERNFKNRLTECIEIEGRHSSDVIFKLNVIYIHVMIFSVKIIL
jgi:hypothetical protein